MLSEGLVLMLVGMGTVYAFLYLMVLVMRSIAVVVPRFDALMPEKQTAAPAPRARASEEDGTAVAVAIAAALQRLRR